MDLTDEQKKQVAEWVAEGATLSEVQSRVLEEFGVSMTYMDTRFLVLELDVEVHDREPKRETPTDVASGELVPPEGQEAGKDAGPAATGVSVDIDRVMKPGSLVSGSVRFSDGVTATWSLDQFGRLALDASQPGYRPGEDDLEMFQQELRKALEGRGF